VSWWDQIRAALGAMWRPWPGPTRPAASDPRAWLAEAAAVEQRLSAQLRQVIPAVPYEQFRRCLEAMADDDAQHARDLHERLKALGVPASPALEAAELSENSAAGSPWRRLQRILAAKRELYENYRVYAPFVEDPALQAVCDRIRQEEAGHQEQLLDVLTHLDAHVPETLT
jgi:rubrerythrin